MNYTNFIVKIVGKPKHSFFPNNIYVTKILVNYVPIRKKSVNTKKIFQISIWNRFSYDNTKMYQLNDYLIVEGYISLRPSTLNTSNFQNDKQVEISVLKLHPLNINKKNL